MDHITNPPLRGQTRGATTKRAANSPPGQHRRKRLGSMFGVGSGAPVIAMA